MIAIDTSVAVACFASWHTSHDAARRAVADGAVLPAHAVLETYSVLTRLHKEYRSKPEIAAEFLKRNFAGRILHLEDAILADLPSRLARLGISGGATYDAVIASTAIEAGAQLLTADTKALATYAKVGASVSVLSAT